MKDILIIEDDHSIVELIRYNLEAENYLVDVAYDGEVGYQKLLSGSYRLLLLDLMIPKIDGISLCKMIRENNNLKNLPVIILTAKGEEVDKVLGLEIGADDYMTKPFSVRELKARISAVLRRYERSDKSSLIIKRGDLIINEEEFIVTQGERVLELTLKEFMLLKTLCENQGKVLSRSYLLDKIWGYEYMGETRTVDVHIRHLRTKLDNPDVIETVRGVGYKFIA